MVRDAADAWWWNLARDNATITHTHRHPQNATTVTTTTTTTNTHPFPAPRPTTPGINIAYGLFVRRGAGETLGGSGRELQFAR